MALIPKSGKSTSLTDGGLSMEVICVLCGLILIVNMVFGKTVHPWLSWILIILIGIVGAILILPSTKNNGRIGYMRIMYFIRFSIYKNKKKGKLK